MDTICKKQIAAFCIFLSAYTIDTNLIAQDTSTLQVIEVFNNTEGVEINKVTRELLARYNNDLFSSSRLEIVSNGSVIKKMIEKVSTLTDVLGEDGIPTSNLKIRMLHDQKSQDDFKLKSGFLYLAFNVAEKKAYTKGMNLISRCSVDTLVESDQNYGLYYNKCDFDEKKQLPTVRVWGMEAHNGVYNETPSKAIDYYVNHVLTVFTILRNDSDDVPDGVVIPVNAGIQERKLSLEKYLPRAYKWVPATEVTTGIIKRDRRHYLFADLDRSGHYRFVTEPMNTSSIFFVDAPSNTCFKEIVIDQGSNRTYKGTLFNGKTRAAFITPNNPSGYNCSIKLIDVNGNEMEITNRTLESLTEVVLIDEKSKNQFKFDLPGYKSVTAQFLYTISKSKKNNNKPLYSKL